MMTPVHPGEVLKEEFMVPLGISANALARAIHVPPNRVAAIVNGTRGVTADTALRFAKVFGTTPEFWLNLQQRFELDSAVGAMHNIGAIKPLRGRSVGDHLVALIRDRFPPDAEFRETWQGGDLVLHIDWRLGTDERPNKPSREIKIVWDQAFVQDYKDSSESMRRELDLKFTRFVEDKLRSFDPEHTTPRHLPAPSETWTFGTEIFHRS